MAAAAAAAPRAKATRVVGLHSTADHVARPKSAAQTLTVPGSARPSLRRSAKDVASGLSAYVLADESAGADSVSVSLRRDGRLVGATLRGHRARIVDMEFLPSPVPRPAPPAPDIHVLGTCDADGVVFLWFLELVPDAPVASALRVRRKYSFYSLRKSAAAHYARIRLAGTPHAGFMVLVPNDGSNVRVIRFAVEAHELPPPPPPAPQPSATALALPPATPPPTLPAPPEEEPRDLPHFPVGPGVAAGVAAQAAAAAAAPVLGRVDPEPYHAPAYYDNGNDDDDEADEEYYEEDDEEEAAAPAAGRDFERRAPRDIEEEPAALMDEAAVEDPSALEGGSAMMDRARDTVEDIAPAEYQALYEDTATDPRVASDPRDHRYLADAAQYEHDPQGLVRDGARRDSRGDQAAYDQRQVYANVAHADALVERDDGIVETRRGVHEFDDDGGDAAEDDDYSADEVVDDLDDEDEDEIESQEFKDARGNPQAHMAT